MRGVQYNLGLIYVSLGESHNASVCFHLALRLDQPRLPPRKRAQALGFLRATEGKVHNNSANDNSERASVTVGRPAMRDAGLSYTHSRGSITPVTSANSHQSRVTGPPGICHPNCRKCCKTARRLGFRERRAGSRSLFPSAPTWGMSDGNGSPAVESDPSKGRGPHHATGNSGIYVRTLYGSTHPAWRHRQAGQVPPRLRDENTGTALSIPVDHRQS